ncbi:hypothetical protein NKR23_g11142 [Pleurostoma richardsiae]|uniref:Uncharacterized protein n=1 Tax=Pleurostoma richardsiae TaxID=41990 RepID=A0AA38RCR7_9PEZI|nr:hypothetical protein NKR23_g11142 [Pleurostoma richardsiae]
MASFDRGFSTSSPVLGIQPQPVHRFPFDKPILSHQSVSFSHSGSWPHQPALGSSSTFAGRKRSRDEASVNLDNPEKTVPAPSIEEHEDEWEYGPGMIIIKKKSGYVVDAGSQSGTWVEEKAADQRAKQNETALLAQQHEAQERPSLRSHKSQRLDMTATVSSDQQQQPSRLTSAGRDVAESDTSKQPIVDNFTLHLGIGWSQISSDEHIQAAARGWARFIENHFPVTDAKIRVESRGLQSYLVEAAEGYFLFAENLRQGRLVSKDSDRALQNLKSSPPVFDGPQIMTAAESPKPEDTSADEHTQKATVADIDMVLN